MDTWDGELLLSKDRDNILSTNSSFTFIKTIPNEKIIQEYNIDIDKILRQVLLDIRRQDTLINDLEVEGFGEIMDFINVNPYLKSRITLVLLFMTQIALTIPVAILYNLVTKLNADYVVAEKKIEEHNRRAHIKLHQHGIIVKKRLNCVLPTLENIQEVFSFDILMENDLVFDETTVYIKSTPLK